MSDERILPLSRRFPSLILFFFTAIGIPTAAGLTFTEKVTQNPWLTLLLFLLYEAAVFCIGFVSKVWTKIEPKWIERAAQ